MDASTPEPTDANVEQPTEAQPTRLQSFVNKHPRAARVVAITGAVTATIGALHVARTVSARKQHLENAADHAKDALREAASSVSPTDTEA